jgi:hypothetical protein
MYETLERNPFHYDGQSRRLSASCGIGEVMFPCRGEDREIAANPYLLFAIRYSLSAP